MYDSVRLVAFEPDVRGAVRALDRAVEQTCLETGTMRYAGRVENLKVRVSEKRLNVQGSLARFLRESGWRGEHPSRRDIRVARRMLEDRLGQDLGLAAVWRMDVYADLALAKSASHYLSFLTAKDRFQRSAHDGTSVYFSVGRRQLAFYDKAAEQKRQIDGGLLRYELRFLNGLSAQMGRPVTFADLHERSHWMETVDRWEEEYATVAKRGVLSAPTGRFKPRAFVHRLAAEAYGAGELIAFLKSEYDAGNVTRSEYHTARTNLLDALDDPAFSPSSVYAEELDEKVSGAAARMREGGA